MKYFSDNDDLKQTKAQRDALAKAFNILIVMSQTINRNLDLENQKEALIMTILRKAQEESLAILLELKDIK